MDYCMISTAKITVKFSSTEFSYSNQTFIDKKTNQHRRNPLSLSLLKLKSHLC